MPFLLLVAAFINIGNLVLPTYAHEGAHGGDSCYNEHSSVSGQIGNADLLNKHQQQTWAQTSTVINTAAIQRPTTSPVVMQFLNGKIMPSSGNTMSSAYQQSLVQTH